MYKIVTPVWKKESIASSKAFVHPFYRTMFKKLYKLTDKEVDMCIGKHGAITDSCDFLIPLVKEVWEKNISFVHQFYDIRTNEETGQVAPEYAILKGAGIRDISPVNIRGMGSMALLFGLQVIDTMIIDGNGVIILLAEKKYDYLYPKENIACAFALYPCKSIDNKPGIWIVDYQIHLTANEMYTAIKNFKGTVIFSEVELEKFSVFCKYTLCKQYGVIEPLLYLFDRMKKAEEADVLVVYVSGNMYGLIFYHVLGEEVR